MRFTIILVTLAILGGGGYYLWETNPSLQHKILNTNILEKIPLRSKEFCTLEIRHSAESLMSTHKNQLLKNSGYSYLEPQLTFHPYLMMEVKYANNKKTEEGPLLFGLIDGEMVIDGSVWEKSHGFEDCLLASATKEDFKILKLVTDNGGTIDKESLYLKSKVDNEVTDSWLEKCRAKKLVVVEGNMVRLHLEKPKLSFTPLTKLKENLVTLTIKETIKVPSKYRANQVKTMAEAAFGTDFAIRFMEEIYLPVHSIRIQNPDGSILTTQWNGLTGLRMN